MALMWIREGIYKEPWLKYYHLMVLPYKPSCCYWKGYMFSPQTVTFPVAFWVILMTLVLASTWRKSLLLALIQIVYSFCDFICLVWACMVWGTVRWLFIKVEWLIKNRDETSDCFVSLWCLQQQYFVLVTTSFSLVTVSPLWSLFPSSPSEDKIIFTCHRGNYYALVRELFAVAGVLARQFPCCLIRCAWLLPKISWYWKLFRWKAYVLQYNAIRKENVKRCSFYPPWRQAQRICY